MAPGMLGTVPLGRQAGVLRSGLQGDRQLRFRGLGTRLAGRASAPAVTVGGLQINGRPNKGLRVNSRPSKFKINYEAVEYFLKNIKSNLYQQFYLCIMQGTTAVEEVGREFPFAFASSYNYAISVK